MMGLTYIQLQKVAPYIRGRVLSLGYPDLVVTADQCQEILGVTPRSFTKNGAWHGVAFDLPETESTFRALGATLTCVDMAVVRGGEIVADLNQPQTFLKYDLVIDPGTTEHCFNIGQALMNAAEAVEIGGWIFHCPPVSMVNHGFYNLCPTLFHDFYTQNGWNVKVSASKGNAEIDIAPTGRYGLVPEMSLLVLAQRNNDAPLRFPVQTKYRANPLLEKAA